MNTNQMTEAFSECFKKEFQILKKKSADYSVESDILEVFKNTANTLKTNPEMVALQMIAIKTERLSNLLKSNKKAKNESIRDSISDLRNYAFILECIIIEKEVKNDTSEQ
jgi:hypothetical protein